MLEASASELIEAAQKRSPHAARDQVVVRSGVQTDEFLSWCRHSPNFLDL